MKNYDFKDLMAFGMFLLALENHSYTLPGGGVAS